MRVPGGFFCRNDFSKCFKRSILKKIFEKHQNYDKLLKAGKEAKSCFKREGFC